MSKWEYCSINWLIRQATRQEMEDLRADESLEVGFIDIDEERVLAKAGSVHFFSTPDNDFKFTELDRTMTLLGADGWELVSHVEVTLPIRGAEFYFKRRKDETT